jgi:hypothetical protein
MINKAILDFFLIKKVYKMKKIGKLSINPEKVIKNEELVNLRGGSYGGTCDGVVTCSGGNSAYFCACLSAVGAWCGCYSSEEWADTWAGVGWCELGAWECYEG